MWLQKSRWLLSLLRLLRSRECSGFSRDLVHAGGSQSDRIREAVRKDCDRTASQVEAVKVP